MSASFAIQLYTVREALQENFVEVIEKIARMGYDGVETAGFPPGVTPREAAQLFRKLGLTVCSAHAPLPLGDKKNEVLDTLAALGCQRIISAYMPPENYESIDKIRRVCDTMNEANAIAVANGLSFGVHNHWWEFEEVEGTIGYKLWLEHLDPAIFFEIDTYWVKTTGLDPAAIVAELGSRAPLLHIKDGSATQDAPTTAVGEGIMDFSAIFTAAGDNLEWAIVELDRCATDMMTAVQKSCQYLASAGFASGNL